MNFLKNIILLFLVTLTISCNGPKALVKDIQPKKKYPLCILITHEVYTTTLTDLHEEEEGRYKEFPYIEEAWLKHGGFFLNYRTSFLINNNVQIGQFGATHIIQGYEIREHKLAHIIPANDGRYEIYTTQSGYTEYQNGKEISHRHPLKSWLEWEFEDYSDGHSDAAKMLKYYFWQKDRYPNTIENTLERLNSLGKDDIVRKQFERYEKEIKKNYSNKTKVTGEVRDLIEETKTILKELGTEIIWNKEKKEYNFK